MAGYIILGKFTEKGRESLQKGPRTAEYKALAESMGIKTVGVWVTMGRYDLVGVLDAPDDETMAQFLVAAGVDGTATTETMRAFSEDEVASIASRVRGGRQ